MPYSELKWETSEGEDRWRRSLYTVVRRSSPYPSLVTFDAPSREQCTVRRVRTNTPLQALTTLNDPVFVEAARKLAGRMLAEAERGAGGAGRPRLSALHGARVPRTADLARCWRSTSARQARLRERSRGPRRRSWQTAGACAKPGSTQAALTMVANVLLSLDATLTKE